MAKTIISGSTKFPTRSSADDNSSHTDKEPLTDNGKLYYERYGYVNVIPAKSIYIPAQSVSIPASIPNTDLSFNISIPITPSVSIPITPEIDVSIPRYIIKTDSKRKRTIEELFDSLGGPSGLGVSRYGTALIKHFKSNKGTTITFNLDFWNTSSSFIDPIKEFLHKEEETLKKGGKIDISKALKNSLASFGFGGFFLDTSEALAFGGIQGVEVNGTAGDFEEKEETTYFQGIKTKWIVGRVEIALSVLLKDWFGVDEGDFATMDINHPNKSFTAWIGRDALACFWILQHQKGYLPFIQQLKYSTTFTLYFRKQKIEV